MEAVIVKSTSVERWKLAKAQYEMAKAELAEARDTLIEEVGTDFRGDGIVVRERQTTGSIDIEAVEKVLGCSVDIFRKPGRTSVVVEVSRRAVDHVEV